MTTHSFASLPAAPSGLVARWKAESKLSRLAAACAPLLQDMEQVALCPASAAWPYHAGVRGERAACFAVLCWLARHWM